MERSHGRNLGPNGGERASLEGAGERHECDVEGGVNAPRGVDDASRLWTPTALRSASRAARTLLENGPGAGASPALRRAPRGVRRSEKRCEGSASASEEVILLREHTRGFLVLGRRNHRKRSSGTPALSAVAAVALPGSPARGPASPRRRSRAPCRGTRVA